jgi:hypothetical protein
MHPTGDRFRHGSPLSTYDRFGDHVIVPVRASWRVNARSLSSGSD